MTYTLDQPHIALLSPPPAILPLPKARELRDRLQADDPEWTYQIELVGRLRAKIAVYDEDGHFVSYL